MKKKIIIIQNASSIQSTWSTLLHACAYSTDSKCARRKFGTFFRMPYGPQGFKLILFNFMITFSFRFCDSKRFEGRANSFVYAKMINIIMLLPHITLNYQARRTLQLLSKLCVPIWYFASTKKSGKINPMWNYKVDGTTIMVCIPQTQSIDKCGASFLCIVEGYQTKKLHHHMHQVSVNLPLTDNCKWNSLAISIQLSCYFVLIRIDWFKHYADPLH